ncbi:glycerophosphodiester phosphodiesterase [Desulfovibrio sp. JC022]|uniref:glycerophosphodiester phosphodiesterase n=1 Tax=Desulfovibrio sp. JC022 TaxID=2593642 RepID=UPI0013D58BDA|nr:glycerophosphodiester phosphodiesterase [Desulfovibrio sp. JC022]NDV24252.1 glycerophosphodiester phosphodiesterase [Desulfovibrio sp. JC022]
MILIGHRGCKYPGYNQNTIRSFTKVTSEGVAAIEFDVQLSADKELVIVHNLDLEEVSTGKGEVSSTDSATLKNLFAGDPTQGEDRIPFLADVFDFFASCAADKRPAIHMELKGNNTGRMAGELFNKYVAAEKLSMSDMLVSSFNWKELEAIREVCPEVKVALLDGAIRRNLLLKKTGPQAEQYFAELFAYGNEDYMLPRFPVLADNLKLLDRICADQQIHSLLSQELKDCLNGRYYTDELLDSADSMKATSINLWYRTVAPEFIEKAHARGLAVFVYTANLPEEWTALADMGIDGVFTDFYAEAARTLADYKI